MSGSAPVEFWDPTMRSLLDHMAKVDASDLYVTAGSPPVFRIEGVGYPAKAKLEAGVIAAMADTLMTEQQQLEFANKFEMNLALSNGPARFRVNMFRQRGAVGMVVRLVRTKIKTLAELGHPPVLSQIMRSKRGLILVVGGTGSGKSTTLAAMIDERNRTATGHIITIEDPVEFVHEHQQCVVTQREVGIDTLSYKDALKNTLRQAPDVILIGEIRDSQTMEYAIEFAETGHLCIATLHANNANQAIERVLNFFAHERQNEIRMQLSLNLRAIISQRLVPSLIGNGRAAALEVLLDTPRIKDLVKKGDIESIKDAMEQGVNEGCCSFDQALFDLTVMGRIDESEAYKAADSPNNLRLLVERFRRSGGNAFDTPELKLVQPKRPSIPQLAPPPAVRR